MLRCISMRLLLRYTASPHRERSIGRLESLQGGDQPSPFPPPCREWITWSVSSLSSSSSSLELRFRDGGAPRTELGGFTSKQRIAACLDYKSCLRILIGASESCLGAPSWPNVWVQTKTRISELAQIIWVGWGLWSMSGQKLEGCTGKQKHCTLFARTFLCDVAACFWSLHYVYNEKQNRKMLYKL